MYSAVVTACISRIGVTERNVKESKLFGIKEEVWISTCSKLSVFQVEGRKLKEVRQVEQKKLDEMGKIELCQYMNEKPRTAKEYRATHRALKKYDDGLEFRLRYPNLPLITATVALVIDVLLLAASFIAHIIG